MACARLALFATGFPLFRTLPDTGANLCPQRANPIRTLETLYAQASQILSRNTNRPTSPGSAEKTLSPPARPRPLARLPPQSTRRLVVSDHHQSRRSRDADQG